MDGNVRGGISHYNIYIYIYILVYGGGGDCSGGSRHSVSTRTSSTGY